MSFNHFKIFLCLMNLKKISQIRIKIARKLCKFREIVTLPIINVVIPIFSP